MGTSAVVVVHPMMATVETTLKDWVCISFLQPWKGGLAAIAKARMIGMMMRFRTFIVTSISLMISK